MCEYLSPKKCLEILKKDALARVKARKGIKLSPEQWDWLCAVMKKCPISLVNVRALIGVAGQLTNDVKLQAVEKDFYPEIGELVITYHSRTRGLLTGQIIRASGRSDGNKIAHVLDLADTGPRKITAIHAEKLIPVYRTDVVESYFRCVEDKLGIPNVANTVVEYG